MGLVTKLVEEYGVANAGHSWILMNNLIHGIAELILVRLWAIWSFGQSLPVELLLICVKLV